MQNPTGPAGAFVPSDADTIGATDGNSTGTQIGFAGAMRIMTADGPIPVDCLRPGDRIVTRDRGMVRLRSVVSAVFKNAAPVVLAHRALGHARPDRPLWVGAQQPLLLRGWRAQTLLGQPSALAPAARLIDHTHVWRAEVQPRLRLFRLVFQHSHIVYAEGAECATGPQTPSEHRAPTLTDVSTF